MTLFSPTACPNWLFILTPSAVVVIFIFFSSLYRLINEQFYLVCYFGKLSNFGIRSARSERVT